ncbi:nucleotidyltransferase domain-containing protein [Candidatus Woesearchaeota archaeon]|nr:nucleotidyltransferase domain-containing protein [Candidatus Woesearchaeota archaeon]
MEIFVTNKRDAVLEHFLLNPASEFHLRELARLVKVSFPWVRKVVNELVKEGYLVKKKRRGLVLVRADRESKLFLALKRSHNLFRLYKSGLVSYLVDNYTRPEAVVLFGSYSRGEDTETSDVDIAVITSSRRENFLAGFEKVLRRKVRVIEMRKAEASDEFWNTLINGIVLCGYLQRK